MFNYALMKKSVLDCYENKAFRDAEKKLEKYQKRDTTADRLATYVGGGSVFLSAGVMATSHFAGNEVLESVSAVGTLALPVASVIASYKYRKYAQEKISEATKDINEIVRESYNKNKVIHTLLRSGKTQEEAERVYNELTPYQYQLVNDSFDEDLKYHKAYHRTDFDYSYFVSDDEREFARQNAEAKEKEELEYVGVVNDFDFDSARIERDNRIENNLLELSDGVEDANSVMGGE